VRERMVPHHPLFRMSTRRAVLPNVALPVQSARVQCHGHGVFESSHHELADRAGHDGAQFDSDDRGADGGWEYGELLLW